MRVAFADMLFSWPPNGGADVDLYHVITALRSEGVDARLFYAQVEGADDRGIVNLEQLPFPAEAVHFEKANYNAAQVTSRFRAAVDTFNPEVVFATHAFALKPALLRGLAHYPLVSRYYAHELTCARDPRRFKDGSPCSNDYLRTPEICRACALESQRTFITSGNHRAWTADYLAAEAYRPAHHAETLDTLGRCKVLVVYNESLREELLAFHPDVRVVPGGVDMACFAEAEQSVESGHLVILMSGRADDPLKGLDTLNEAGRHLWEKRQDFQIRVTHYDAAIQTPWLRCEGWRDHAGALALYGKADIVAVPSIWREPFGLTAVEAMASGRPVVASRTGGLKDIVRDGETGLLAEPGNVDEWVKCLAALLDDPSRRRAMGEEGRRVAMNEYDWPTVVRRHYLPLLEELIR